MRRVSLLLSLLLHMAAQAQPRSLAILIYPNEAVFEAVPGADSGGPGGAMLKRLQALSGVTLKQQFMPYPRALITARQHPDNCMIAVSRAPEREASLMWAGPWARGATAVYARAEDTRTIQHPEEMRSARIVVLRDSAPADWLKSQDMQPTEVKDNTTALRMLQAKRVDYWVANSIAAHFVVRAEGGQVPRQLYNFGRIDLYIGCHAGSDPAAVAALDNALAQMRRYGELAEFGMR